MKMIPLVTGIALFLAATQGAAQAQSIDDFTVLDQQKFNCARTVAIKLFPVEGEFKAANDLRYYQNYFATRLASALNKIRGIEKVQIVDGDAAVSADLMIDGSFIDLTSGSGALRFWVGFGAGKSIGSVDMKGLDGATGSEVFRLEHYRSTSLATIDDDAVAENLDKVILDVVAGLSSARGACGAQPAKVAAK